MRVGIIGAGTIFDDHMRAYAEIGVDVGAIVDVDVDRANMVAGRYGIPRVFTDWSDLLGESDIDIIDICAPPCFHADIAIQSLNAGKHVVCEKPLAPTLAEVDRVLEAENRSSSKLTVVHQLRFFPISQRLKYLVERGVLGDICFARTLRYSAPPKRLVDSGTWGTWESAGGGVLMTKAIHQLDLLCWLLGPPVRVEAMMGTFVTAIESEDHVTASIEFERGTLANIAVSGTRFGGVDHVDLIGERGTAREPWLLRLADSDMQRHLNTELEKRFPLERSAARTGRLTRVIRKLGAKEPAGRRTSNHTPLLRSFVESIKNDFPVPVSSSEARTAVELCTAIYASAISGAPVELPIGREHRFYDGVAATDYSGAGSAPAIGQ